MPMKVGTEDFKKRVDAGLTNTFMRGAVSGAQDRLEVRRQLAAEELGDWEEWRSLGEEIRQHVLENLDFYLHQLSENVAKRGGHVFFAATAEDANHYIMDNLIRARSIHIQHMQKALQLMNLRLTTVISDITGQTGLQIIRAIVAGEHDPVTLARYRNPRCKSSQTDIAQALTGHYRPEHLFMLQQSLELYDFYNHQLQACDAEIEQLYQQLAAQTDFTELPEGSQRRSNASKNEPDFDLRTYLYQLSGVDLVQIDGIEALTAQTILSEIGPDVSGWPTVKHFASWLGLAPQKNQSGGRERPAKTAKNKNRVAEALRMAAQSLSRSQSALGAFYRRVRAKHGGPAAVVATAHKLARMVYFRLKYRQDYVDPGQDYYEQQYRERVLKNLNRKAKALGMELVPSHPVVS